MDPAHSVAHRIRVIAFPSDEWMSLCSLEPLILLHDDFVVNCSTSWMILPPVVLMYQDLRVISADFAEKAPILLSH